MGKNLEVIKDVLMTYVEPGWVVASIGAICAILVCLQIY